jgi:quinol monooxygenase YgiN
MAQRTAGSEARYKDLGPTDPRLFYIHSHWIDETAFDTHAELPHTVMFLERVEPIIDHPLDVTRTVPLDP